MPPSHSSGAVRTTAGAARARARPLRSLSSAAAHCYGCMASCWGSLFQRMREHEVYQSEVEKLVAQLADVKDVSREIETLKRLVE